MPHSSDISLQISTDTEAAGIRIESFYREQLWPGLSDVEVKDRFIAWIKTELLAYDAEQLGADAEVQAQARQDAGLVVID